MISTDSCHLFNSYIYTMSIFFLKLHEINILKFFLILSVAKYLRVSDNLIASRMNVFLLLNSGDTIFSKSSKSVLSILTKFKKPYGSSSASSLVNSWYAPCTVRLGCVSIVRRLNSPTAR